MTTGLFAIALALSSVGLRGAEADVPAQKSEIDLMIEAVKALEAARNPSMAEVLKRGINARQIRKLGNLGNLTAADYEVLKAAPTASKEQEALKIAVTELKRDGKGESATALQTLLNKRAAKKTTATSSKSRQASDIARLESKIDRIQKMLTEVESELAKLKAQ